MANCPNCGRSTARTKDWCCQWCGYPLFSGNFKTIDKTYKELKGDRLSREAVIADEPDVPDEEPEEVTVEEPVQPEPRTVAEETVRKVETIIEETIIEDADETAGQEPVQRVIRRVRRVRPEPTKPVRRVVRRRRPDPRSREEVEEIIEYIDETPEENEDYYEDYVEASDYEDDYEDDESSEDDESYEYEEEPEQPRGRVVRRPAEPESPRRERPQRPVRKNKILRRREPEPEEPVEYIEDDYEDEDLEEYGDEAEEITDEAEIIEDEDDYESELTDDEDDFDDYEDEDDEDDEYPEEEGYEIAAPAAIAVEDEDPDIELSVDDLVTAYETEGPDADVRYNRKVLRISGVISKVDVKESMSVYALVLEAGDGSPLRQMLRCVFTRENGLELQSLMPAQNVIVQGTYDGSIINISMRDCRLISILD